MAAALELELDAARGDRHGAAVRAAREPAALVYAVAESCRIKAAYVAAKHGVVGLTKTLAKEWGQFKINVNAVAFGYIETRLTDVLPDDVKQKMLASTSLGRFGQPEDIARAVRFLCSDEAAFITGEVLVVDGGMAM